MEAVLGAYDPDSDDLSYTDGLSYDGSEDDYDASSNFYYSDDDDEDVVVDVPFVHEFMEGELEAANWPIIDNLQLAFITSCKITAEQENPDYSVIKLVLMQNTLKKIYDDWAANAPESEGESMKTAIPQLANHTKRIDPEESPVTVQSKLSLSDAPIDEANQLEPIAVAPRRASLNANIPPKSEEIVIPQRTTTSRAQQPTLSPPPSPPKDSAVIPPVPPRPVPITSLDSAFDAYLTLTLDDLAQSAGPEEKEKAEPAASNVEIPTRTASHNTAKSETIPISISARKDSISSTSTNSSSGKPLIPSPTSTTVQVSSQAQQTSPSPLPPTPPLSNSPPKVSPQPSIIIQPRTHSRKANAIIMNSINQPIRIIPITPRGIPSRQRQQTEPLLSLQEEYSFLSRYYLTNSLLPPRSDEEQEGALHRNASITSSIMRANSMDRRPSKLTARSSSGSMPLTPTTPTTPSSFFSTNYFQNHVPTPSTALIAATPLSSPPSTPTPPPRKKKIVRNKPLPTPPTSFPSVFPIDDVRGTNSGVDPSFSFDAGSREELSFLTRSNSIRSTGTKTSRNSSRLSVPGGGEWAESVVNTFLQRTSVFLGGGAGGGASASTEWGLDSVDNGGKVVTEKRSRSLKRGSGKVKSAGSGDLFAMYQEHGGGGSQSGSPISTVSPPVPGSWNLESSSASATAVTSGGVAKIPTRSSSRIVNPEMESSLMAKYQLLVGQQQPSQKNK
ncbi:UNVERIFIED_CONTAM: hypothetical protein HDU68_005955 [Siphonaria sp. JEL0065]|nr:hypothetical protein HDU68_005955 [Siphonaria sp. JEL0065]